MQKNKSLWLIILASSLFLAFITMAANAALPISEAHVLINLKGFSKKDPLTPRVCSSLQKSVSDWSFNTLPLAVCEEASTNQYRELSGFLVTLENKPSENIWKLKVENLKPDDVTDPVVVRWQIHTHTVADNEKGIAAALESMQTLLKKYAGFQISKEISKENLLAAGAAESKVLLAKEKDDIVNYRDAQTGQHLDFHSAYQKYLSENVVQKNYLAAGLEMAAFLGVAVANYYLPSAYSNPNRYDWDYNAATSLRGRYITGEAYRFDDNSFVTNRGHYGAGTGYYTIARSAGLSRLQSLLVTFAGSTFWECCGEFREVVSFPDQINTTFGGAILGETIFQITKIFRMSGNPSINHLFNTIGDGPRDINNWFDKKATGRLHLDEHDSNPDIWAKFDMFAEGLRSANGNHGQTVGMDAQVIAIPLFEEPGQVKELLTDTVFSRLMIEDSVGSGINSFKLFAKTALAAYYKKKLEQKDDDTLEGYNLFVGPSWALEINDENGGATSTGSPLGDFRGIVHIIGSTLDITGYHNGFRFRCIIDVYGDFAMMRSYAFDAYRDGHNVTNVQSVLQNQNYYYGYGPTEMASLSVEKNGLTVGAEIEQTSTAMINWRGRFASQTDEVSPADRVKTEHVWVAYQLSKHFKVELGARKIERNGDVKGDGHGGASISASDLQKYGRLIYIYK